MTRRFVVVTAALFATVAFLVGLIVAGSMTPSKAGSAPTTPSAMTARPAASDAPAAAALGIVSFADVAERLNPAVVNIDATSRREERPRRRFALPVPDSPDMFERRFDGDEPRKGTGTGFLIDSNGYILTNHHVVDGAERIMVRLTDGRSLRARPVGSDPDTDIALIKVDGASRFVYAALGDSDTLRVGEWVCAIGNPLAYEHTVTVGVVSFIGRKLFDHSLDRYIQTDAAINFGNSGGPLINSRGEVIGINAAISSRASNIGFAVPINQAREILPQLREQGRVSRGYIGVALKDVDADLQRSLRLSSGRGALVQDVTGGSPAARAGLRIYDLIVALDGRPVGSNDALIRDVAARKPGTTVTLQIVRDGQALSVPVKLAERPLRDRRTASPRDENGPAPRPSSRQGNRLGLQVRELDARAAARLRVPEDLDGVLVSRVEAMSPAFDADIERGHIVLEVNRTPIRTIEDYRRLTTGARSGDVLTLYIYKPEVRQRALHTVRIDER